MTSMRAGFGLGVLFAAICVSLAGCSLLEVDPWEDRRAELERHRDVWQAQQIDDYRFELLKSTGEMFMDLRDQAFHLTVVVQNDSIRSATFIASGTPLAEEHYHWLSTVDGLFEVVATAIERRPDRFGVEYDPIFGYPTRISVDYSRDYLDDEYSVRASDLESFEE